MNRRAFLKRMGITIGAAFLCPNELFRQKTEIEKLVERADFVDPEIQPVSGKYIVLMSDEGKRKWTKMLAEDARRESYMRHFIGKAYNSPIHLISDDKISLLSGA